MHSPRRSDTAAPEGADTGLHLPDEQESTREVLREISHDFANHFHRLYLFVDQLRNTAGGQPGAAATIEELDALGVRMEALAKATLSYFSPVQARCRALRVSDVTASIRHYFPSRDLDVRDQQGCGDRSVLVDPGLLAAALQALCERIAESLQPGRAVEVAIGEAGEAVSWVFSLGAEQSVAPLRGLGLATAAKYLRAQGGALREERAVEGEGYCLRVVLPAAGEERG